MAKKNVTTAEMLGRDLTKRAKVLKDMRAALEKIDTSNSVYRKNVDDWEWTDYFKALAENVTNSSRMTGATLLWMIEHLVRGINGAFVDNFLVREFELVAKDSAIKTEQIVDEKTGKKHGETKVTRFVKKNPWVIGYLSYWVFLMANVAFVGGVSSAVIADEKDEPKKEILQNAKEGLVIQDLDAGEVISEEFIDGAEEKVVDDEKVGVSDVVKMDPASADFIKQCISLENITCIPIVYTETHRAEPVVQYRENVWTHGFGMTWSRDKSGHMKIRDYADTPANRRKGFKPHKPKKTANMDVDIAETQQFLIDQVYPLIRMHIKRPITENEFYGICVAGYQLTGHIDEICKKLNKAKTPQQIADAFITPGYDLYGGTPMRRWVCGLLAAGYITMQDVLNADIDNFYSANINTVVRNGHFVTNQKTIKYVMGLPGPGKKKTITVIRSLKDGRLALNQLEGKHYVRTVAKEDTEADKKLTESMTLLLQANAEYRAGRLEAAIEVYEQVIKKDPDNMEVYSSLALAYKKMGDKKKSIRYYEKSIEMVSRGNARMNANRALLLDRSVKAASYYNAGSAREEIAKLYLAQGKNDEARKNYDLAIKNYQTALENAEESGLSDGRKKVYQEAIKRVTQQMKGMKKGKIKQHAWNKGMQEIDKKKSRSDLLLYGTTYKGNIV